ncbi:hypothetical protein VNO78_20871 [Psophocarpus tetragonolobus]|uniref:Uncharacterized protein n=1 Tax=Psophocarpus tetragonolobus TaxID=3891 RepID=A0AAN9SAL0_PSOTE
MIHFISLFKRTEHKGRRLGPHNNSSPRVLLSHYSRATPNGVVLFSIYTNPIHRTRVVVKQPNQNSHCLVE